MHPMEVTPLDHLLRLTLPQRGRSAVGYLRTAVAGPIRAWRRRARLARLRSAPAPRRILFLCQGNLYRSPYAAAVFRASLPASLRHSVRIASAGFMSPGRAVPATVVSLAAARGLELGSHRSALVSTEAISTADLIVVMEPAVQTAICRRFGKPRSEVLVLGELDPQSSHPPGIRDPAMGPLDGLRECFERIDRCASALARALPLAHTDEPMPAGPGERTPVPPAS